MAKVCLWAEGYSSMWFECGQWILSVFSGDGRGVTLCSILYKSSF